MTESGHYPNPSSALARPPGLLVAADEVIE
jgi:hypothetical protein